MDGRLVSLKDLLKQDRVFDIPVYQRGYAWERKNLEDLWEDLDYLDISKKHYFGTVLLKDSRKTIKVGMTNFKRFDVIDGQQRLTTISILLREIISHLSHVGDADVNEDVADLEKGLLKNKGIYKLNPLGDDGKFFHTHVIDGDGFLSSHILTHSQRRLVDAKTFFKERLSEEREQQSSGFEEFLSQLMEKVNELQLIEYQVNLDSDAIRIFETVNDRGRPLSNLEKTKSFLMHTSYLGMEDDYHVEIRIGELNERFSRMYHHLENANGNIHLNLTENQVQRYHYLNYISTGKTSSRPVDGLKDRLRNMLSGDQKRECAEYALEYAKDLERAFLAISGIAESYKHGGPLSKIFLMGRTGNIFPLLIACWLRYRDMPTHMENILRLLEAFIVRVYLVGGYRSHTGASRFNGMAHRVHRGTLDYDSLIGELNQINLDYQSDSGFESVLRSEDYYRNRYSNDIKYLLSEYEIHLRGTKSDLPLAPSTQEEILTPTYEVEHIWAQHPSLEMSEDETLEHQQNVHRLGNLTIASKSWNASMGSKPFEEKRWQPEDKPSYSNSSLLVQKELSNQNKWTAETIREREDRIVQFALQRWSV